ncbi:hypothetical protein BX600DRAFT_434431 [Xylariales sp. PMI_506]|nr:hypothetical protein BX600DRAFT_434431 [Xylariales sp. PMI_506]
MATGLSPVSDTSFPPGRSPHSHEGKMDATITTTEHNNGDFAHRACEKCRASKRKCDKTLPHCTRCTRLNAKCVYLAESVNPNPGANDPLDEVTGPQILSLIGSDAQAAEKIDWVDGVRNYFECIQFWYGVVNQTLFEQQITSLGSAADSPPAQTYSPPLTNSPSDRSLSVSQALTVLSSTPEPRIGRDLALLILAMYMTTRTRFTKTGERQMFDDLYRFLKRSIALALLESSVPKPEMVQCSSLLALYEYGHGDSLAAYRTLSEAVAGARVLGIGPGRLDEGATSMFQSTRSLEEDQESCLWWALFVLDQYIHRDDMSKHLPFILESPEMNTLLPGSVASSAVLPHSGRFDLKYLCEAPSIPRQRMSLSVPINPQQMQSCQLSAICASLLHRALRHEHYVRARTGYLPPVSSFSSLDAEIRKATMSLLADDVFNWQATLDCFAMTVSALFTLYLPYLQFVEKTPPEELKHDSDLTTAIAALRFAAQMSTDISCKVNADILSKGINESNTIRCLVAPAAPTCYFVVRTYVSLRRIFPDEWQHCHDALVDKYESLRLFSYRWGIAERMMRQLEEVAGVDRSEYLKYRPNPLSPVSISDVDMDLST